MYSVDVKDAFLQVPQRTECTCEFPKDYVELPGEEDYVGCVDTSGNVAGLPQLLFQCDSAWNFTLHAHAHHEASLRCP